MSDPEISVVIPVYGRDLELSESIESVFDQTFKNYEIVLVDNNAKKNARIVAEDYANRFSGKVRIVHEPIQGVCSARNTGIKSARGRIIATQDEDDIMKPHRLEYQRDLILSRPDFSMVTSLFDIMSSDASIILEKDVSSATINTKKSFGIIESKIVSLFKSYLDDDYASTFHFSIPSGFMFWKNKALEIGLFDEGFNPQFLEDYDFQVRMFTLGPFGQVPESLFLFRRSQWLDKKKNSDTPEKYQVLPNWHQQDQIFFDSLQDHFLKISNKNKSLLKEIKAVLLRTTGLHALRYPDGAVIGSSLLKRAWLENPKDLFSLKLYLKTFLPSHQYPRIFWFDEFENGTLAQLPKDFLLKFLRSKPCVNSDEQ
ncbi:MAG: glycosyltransferase family 2 protein [Nitrospirae bacterium]|nr:MAG: hypothetical protein D084_Lepto4C00195G0002 [Leptospirillum sp. Group IV 'UBA BS']MCL4486229.1 glycosyltransferase family 2 protein [Nitrospirota bacterium]MCL5285414.1 glycosyltransferase family 2 protein [Nitrospirota bacterium]